MTTTLAPTASPPQAAPHPDLDLDARLALAGAVMDERCTLAALTIDVNTAHIPSEPLPEVVAPPHIAPAPTPCPYSTPLATVLHQAQTLLEQAGWCTGALRDEEGAACLIGAIRTAAADRGQADDACVLLLETIRRDFPTAETVPSWNDAQHGPRLPLIYLGRAAELAHARNQ